MESELPQWLSKLNDELDQIENELVDDKTFQKNLRQIRELKSDINSNPIIMIAGEFNAGKSTFINALLGEEILTSEITPATAVVTVLKYGEVRGITAYFKNGDCKTYSIEKLATISSEGEQNGAFIRKSLNFLEITLPSEILKQVTLVDTPGLNSSNLLHTEATEMFMRRADLAIWLFSYLNVGSSTEINQINKLKDYGLQTTGIINQIDHHDDEEEPLEDFIMDTKRRLPMLQNLIGVSARNALKGKVENDAEQMNWSNWRELENWLDNVQFDPYLKEKKAYVGLTDTLKEIQHCIENEKQKLNFLESQGKINQLIFEMIPNLDRKYDNGIQSLNKVKDFAHTINILNNKKYSVGEIVESSQKISALLNQQSELISELNLVEEVNKFNRFNEEKINVGKELFYLINNIGEEELKQLKVGLSNERNQLLDDYKEYGKSNIFGKTPFWGRLENLKGFLKRQDELNRNIVNFNNEAQTFKEYKNLFQQVGEHILHNIKSFLNKLETAVNNYAKKEWASYKKEYNAVKSHFEKIDYSSVSKLNTLQLKKESIVRILSDTDLLKREYIFHKDLYEEAKQLSAAFILLEREGGNFEYERYIEAQRTLNNMLPMYSLYQKEYRHQVTTAKGSKSLGILQEIDLSINLKEERQFLNACRTLIMVAVFVFGLTAILAAAKQSGDAMNQNVEEEEPSYISDSEKQKEVEEESVEVNRESQNTEIITVSNQVRDYNRAYQRAIKEKNFSIVSPYIDMSGKAYEDVKRDVNNARTERFSLDSKSFYIEDATLEADNMYQVIAANEIITTYENGKKEYLKVKTTYVMKRNYSGDEWKVYDISTIQLDKKTLEQGKSQTVGVVKEEQNIQQFMNQFYREFEIAFNQYNFSRIASFYDPSGSEYQDVQKYFKTMEEKRIQQRTYPPVIKNIQKVGRQQYRIEVQEEYTFHYPDGRDDHKKMTFFYTLKENGYKHYQIVKIDK
ncbi:small GTP-binding protein domain protein [Bacillus cereus BAG5X1-1]|uniref:Small GTP-binding protein domain protein n=1 Tax=Bacillus cereus BAG5X1-1 TaxID=1053189 RepID=J7X4W4_BACCE|nr:dynamin family protein [Bacillus cereus]EJQ39263.1 small GTP-binding protein domain protein [Bacillus cereus BAG5X1-1]